MEPGALEDITYETFIANRAKYGTMSRDNEMLRKICIVHFEPFCRHARRLVALHVARNPQCAWMMEPDPNWVTPKSTSGVTEDKQ